MRVMIMNLQYKGLERQLNIRVRRGREEGTFRRCCEIARKLARCKMLGTLQDA